MYKKRIAELEARYDDIEREIKKNSTEELVQRRRTLLAELATLRRRQFEHDNEYLDMSDDDR